MVFYLCPQALLRGGGGGQKEYLREKIKIPRVSPTHKL